jgi:hypothetical protein
MFNGRRISAGLALIFSFAVLSSAAYAVGRSWVYGDSVRVCVSKANGDMHAIQQYENCKSTEELVVLPLGSGADGATGATGATGPQGATGARGYSGAVGANGATGATGASGANGATGPQGPSGATGDTGVAGATGPAGAVGATGAQGPNGAPGANGATGATGPAGTSGTSGQNAETRFSTATVTLDNTFGMHPVPGLSYTATAGANSVLYVSTDGSIVNNGTNPGDYVQVSVRVLVDGLVKSERLYGVELGPNANAYWTNWSAAITVPVTPGDHVVSVDVGLKDRSGSTTANVAGMSMSNLRGTLNVLVLNK